MKGERRTNPIREKVNPVTLFIHIDNLDFLSLMSHAQALLGNSSGGLVEAPYFQLAAINIGRRQEGRDREKNVIDTKPTEEDIKKKINFVLTDKRFRNILKSCGKRLGDGHSSQKILSIVKKLAINDRLLRKRITY